MAVIIFSMRSSRSGALIAPPPSTLHHRRPHLSHPLGVCAQSIGKSIPLGHLDIRYLELRFEEGDPTLDVIPIIIDIMPPRPIIPIMGPQAPPPIVPPGICCGISLEPDSFVPCSPGMA
jgi:hypothetical protein